MIRDKNATGQVMSRQEFLNALSKRPKKFVDTGEVLKRGLPVPPGEVRAFVCGPHAKKK